MANGTTKDRKGTTNPSIPYPQSTEVKGGGDTGQSTPKKTVQRGHGAATKGFTANGPMG